MRKLFTIFGFVFVLFMMFSAGLSAAHREFQDMASDLLIGAFWLVIAGFALWDAVTDKFAEIASHRHSELGEEFAKDLVSSLDKAFGEAEAKAETQKAATKVSVKGRSKSSKVEVKRMVSAEQLKREERNAKRRAARAAKKPEPTVSKSQERRKAATENN